MLFDDLSPLEVQWYFRGVWDSISSNIIDLRVPEKFSDPQYTKNTCCVSVVLSPYARLLISKNDEKRPLVLIP